MSGNLVGNPINIRSPPAFPGAFTGVPVPDDNRDVKAEEAEG